MHKFLNAALFSLIAASALAAGPSIKDLELTGDARVKSGATFMAEGTGSISANKLRNVGNTADALSYNAATNTWTIVDQSAFRAAVGMSFANLSGKPTSAAGYGIANGAVIDGWGGKAVPSGTVEDTAGAQAKANAASAASQPRNAKLTALTTSLGEAYDLFDRADGLLNGAAATTGQIWNCGGPGAATTAVESGKMASSLNTYNSLPAGGSIKMVAGVFSFNTTGPGSWDIKNGGRLMIGAQPNALDLLNMIHLAFGPTGWNLTKKVGAPTYQLAAGSWTLKTDGTRYLILFLVDTAANTVTVIPPQGPPVTSAPDAYISSIDWTHGTWQITNQTSTFRAYWHAVGLSTTQTVVPKALDIEAAAAQGSPSNTASRSRTVEFSLPASSNGFARFFIDANAAIYSGTQLAGKMRLSITASGYGSQYLEADVLVPVSQTSGNGLVIQNLRERGLPIVTQFRPTSSTTVAALDLNIARSEAITGTIEFEGLSGVPLPKPKAQGAVTAAASTDVFTKTEHGLMLGDQVSFSGLTGGAGITPGTVYFVRDETLDTFKIAATSGGSAIDVTTDLSAGTLSIAPLTHSRILDVARARPLVIPRGLYLSGQSDAEVSLASGWHRILTQSAALGGANRILGTLTLSLTNSAGTKQALQTFDINSMAERGQLLPTMPANYQSLVETLRLTRNGGLWALDLNVLEDCTGYIKWEGIGSFQYPFESGSTPLSTAVSAISLTTKHAARVVQVVAPSSGDTVVVDPSTDELFINNTSTLAALTITLPASKMLGDRLAIVSRSAVTTLTLDGTPTLGTAPTSLSAWTPSRFETLLTDYWSVTP